MTWKKAAPVLIVAGVFDVLRAMCEFLWFFAPVIVAIAVGAKASAYLGAWLGGAVGGLAGGAAAYFASAPLFVMGPILAIAVGFAGWLVVGGLIMVMNRRLLEAEALSVVWLVAGLAFAEMPFIGTLPSLTLTTGRLYWKQIKKERAVFKQWEAEQKALREQEKAEQMQMLMARMQEEAANDNETQEEAEQEEANAQLSQEQAASLAARMRTRVSNDTQEIPAQQKMVA